MSEMVRLALREPVSLGVNVTAMVVFAPGATEMGSGPEATEKSAALGPTLAMPEISNGPLPELLMVTGTGAPDVFTVWCGKSIWDGDMASTGATPLPDD